MRTAITLSMALAATLAIGCAPKVRRTAVFEAAPAPGEPKECDNDCLRRVAAFYTGHRDTVGSPPPGVGTSPYFSGRYCDASAYEGVYFREAHRCDWKWTLSKEEADYVVNRYCDKTPGAAAMLRELLHRSYERNTRVLSTVKVKQHPPRGSRGSGQYQPKISEHKVRLTFSDFNGPNLRGKALDADTSKTTPIGLCRIRNGATLPGVRDSAEEVLIAFRTKDGVQLEYFRVEERALLPIGYVKPHAHVAFADLRKDRGRCKTARREGAQYYTFGGMLWEARSCYTTFAEDVKSTRDGPYLRRTEHYQGVLTQPPFVPSYFENPGTTKPDVRAASAKGAAFAESRSYTAYSDEMMSGRNPNAVAAATAEPTAPAAPTEQDKIQSLKQYKELLDAGVITQEEFDKKKAELLGQ